jgi:hypothetical protein
MLKFLPTEDERQVDPNPSSLAAQSDPGLERDGLEIYGEGPPGAGVDVSRWSLKEAGPDFNPKWRPRPRRFS